jgi:hypothetical protein
LTLDSSRLDRDGEQVPGDGVVDDVLEQLGLGAVEGLDGLDRDPGLLGHAAHGGAWPAEALEGGSGRGRAAAMEAAPDAPAMLDLHARQVTAINERSAQVFWVVEQAAPADLDIARLWAQMTDNRRTGARRAATRLLSKPGLPPHISQDYAEEVFWVAIDQGTYRSLTLGRGFSPASFETWIRNFYDKMLLH